VPSESLVELSNGDEAVNNAGPSATPRSAASKTLSRQQARTDIRTAAASGSKPHDALTAAEPTAGLAPRFHWVCDSKFDNRLCEAIENYQEFLMPGYSIDPFDKILRDEVVQLAGFANCPVEMALKRFVKNNEEALSAMPGDMYTSLDAVIHNLEKEISGPFKRSGSFLIDPEIRSHKFLQEYFQFQVNVRAYNYPYFEDNLSYYIGMSYGRTAPDSPIHGEISIFVEKNKEILLRIHPDALKIMDKILLKPGSFK